MKFVDSMRGATERGLKAKIAGLRDKHEQQSISKHNMSANMSAHQIYMI